jgi:CPA2 family monovalent cation:H+ antiporter-2
MFEITAILLVSAVAYTLAKAARLPTVPVLMLGGIALVRSGLVTEQTFILDMVAVGLAFLVFTAGIDMSPKRVGRYRPLALAIGTAQFFILAAGSAAFTYSIGFSVRESLFVALAISASSTLVVVRLLRQRAEMFESFGRTTIGILLLQDVLVIAGLVGLSFLEHDSTQVGKILATISVLIAGIFIFGKIVLPRIESYLRDDDELLLLVVLSTLFGFCGLAHAGGVPIVAGAFCAGLSLSNFPTRALVNGLVYSVNEFFIIVFFISLGALVQIPSLEILLESLFLTVMIVVVTPLVVGFFAQRAGMTARAGLKSGLLIAQTSEFSIVVVIEGLRLGHIGQDIFSLIVLTTVFTMTLTPFISSDRLLDRLMELAPELGADHPVRERSGHVVVIGAGQAGSLLLNRLKNIEQDTLVIDHDPIVVERVQNFGFDAICGSVEDPRAIEAAAIDEARAVILTTGVLEHLETVINYIDRQKVWFNAFSTVETEQAREEFGVNTISYAEVAAEKLIAWLDEQGASESRQYGSS